MLIFLDQSVADVPTVPINRNDNVPAAGDMLTVIGRGLEQEGGSSLANELREVDIPTVDHDTCNSQNYGNVNEELMLCAAVPEGGKDSCQGDSGGPIMNDAGVQVGVVSWGYG
jgi:trypsin